MDLTFITSHNSFAPFLYSKIFIKLKFEKKNYIVLKSVGRILVSWENVLLNAEIFE